MVFEERMVTHDKWLESFSWQITLGIELSEPPRELLPASCLPTEPKKIVPDPVLQRPLL